MDFDGFLLHIHVPAMFDKYIQSNFVYLELDGTV